MITFGNIYIITKDFDKSVEFYKKLFEKDVTAQNKSRYAIFSINGLGLSILNADFDETHPVEVEHRGAFYEHYDNYKAITKAENSGRIVINLCTDDLQKEYERIKSLDIGNEITQIRYINAKTPYYYFSMQDIDGNTIEITGEYDKAKQQEM